MREMMPIGEINVEEITRNTKKYREKLLEKRDEALKEKIDKLNLISLNNLANNRVEGVYMPYLLDLKLVLERIKGNSRYDTDFESLQIKIDLIEQISKMKEIPSLDTECHIESKYIKKNTSIKGLIFKKIFKQNKYKLVFHGKEATFDKQLYKVSLKKRLFALMCLEILLSILSLMSGVFATILFIASIFIMLLTMYIIEFNI